MGSQNDLPPKSPWELRPEPGEGKDAASVPGLDWLGTQRGSWLDAASERALPGPDLPGLGGRYTELKVLGKGATSTVFRAMDTLLRRPVALKLLRNPGDGALAEARAQAQVEHPNICRIYEVGAGFIVMQLLDGPTLADLAPDLDRDRALAFLRDVARGVHAAHLRGLLHLDLKLNNILTCRNPDGSLTPVVGDFGMTRPLGEPDPDGPRPLGTPPYTSPEQVDENLAALSPASDVYALGVMLYILLSGRSPFGLTLPASLPEAMAQGRWIPLRQAAPSVPRDLATLVERCLQRDPARRYGSAQALADDLDRLLAREPLAVMGRAWGYKAGKRLRKNRRLVLAFGLGVVPLSFVLGLGWRQAHGVVEQAAWDHHFQTLVKDLQVGLESAYRRPPHDIQPDLDAAQATVRAIEREMADNGRAAEGPGQVALGLAALALGGDASEVEGHFQRAWSAGYHTEEVRRWVEALRAVTRTSEGKKGGPTGATGSGLGPGRGAIGRTSLDQVHMAFLVGREALEDAGPEGPRKTLELARAYRRRAPNDIQALLGEWDATVNQMWATWLDLRERDAVRASPQDPSLVALRGRLRALMEEGPALAPSCPGVYLRLAQACRNPLVLPGTRPSEERAALAQAQVWLQQGLAIWPGDPATRDAFLDFMAWDAQGAGLSREAIRGELRRMVDQRPEWAHGLPQALTQHVLEGELRGVPSLAFGGECLRRLWARRGGMKGVANEVAGASAEMASLALARGQDPAPFLALGREALEAGGGVEAEARATRLKLALIDRERDLELGRAPQAGMEAIEKLAAGVDPGLVLSLDLARCRCRAGAPRAWEGLAQALQGPSGGTWVECLMVPFTAPATLGLLEHQASLGQDVRQPLARFTQDLRRILRVREGRPNGVVHGFLARAALLEGRQSAHPRSALEAGLREADLALAAVPWSRSDLETARWAFGNGPARIHDVQGRLWLALAGSEAPPLQGLYAEKAMLAFLKAGEEGPLLTRSLEPLAAQARRWTRARSRSFRSPFESQARPCPSVN
jgi:hypothetical protein